MRAAIVASISVALLLLVLVLASCGKPIPVGTFQGHRNEVGRPGADPVVVAQLNRIILRIDEGGKADLEDGGVPWEGRVSRSGDDLEFEVEALNGINIDRQPTDLARTLKFRILSDDALSFGGVRLERTSGR